MSLSNACIQLRIFTLTALALCIAAAAVTIVMAPLAVAHFAGRTPHLAAALFALGGVVVLGAWVIDRLHYDRRPVGMLFYAPQMMIVIVLVGWAFRYEPPAPPIQSAPLTPPTAMRSAEALELRGFQGD